MNDLNTQIPNNSENKKKKKTIIIAVIVGLVIIGLFSPTNNSSKSGNSYKTIRYSSYKSAVNDFEKSLNKADGDLMCKTILPSEQYSNISQQSIDRINGELAFSIGLAKEMYKSFKFNFKIKDKTKMSSDELFSVQNYYSYHFTGNCPVIKEGYSLKIEYKSYDGEKDTVYLDVVCFEDDGWRVTEQSAGSAFMIPSPVAQSGGGGFDY